MKKVFLCLAVVAMSFSAIGQEKEEKVLRNKGFETNRFIDNWEISLQGGVQAFHLNQGFTFENGDKTWENPIALFEGIGDELMPMYQLSIGKWITPIFGGRLTFQGCGINDGTENNDFSNSTYYYLHTDIMVNLSNWIAGYNPKRLYNAVVFGGFGWAVSQRQSVSAKDWNDEYAASAGLSNRFRLCEALYLNLDLSGFLTKEAFVNHPELEGKFATNYELTAGITYNLPTERLFAVVDYDPYKRKISSLEQDLSASRKDVEKAGEDNDNLKSQLSKERKAKEQALSEVERLKTIIVPSTTQHLAIYFILDSSKITDRNMENIKFLAEAIKSSAKDRVFTITAYADEQTGNPEHNMKLSQRRAEAVYNALVKEGVEESKLKIEYKGDTEQPFTGRPYMNRVAIVK